MVDAANQSVNFATVFSSTGNPARANATTQRYRQSLARSRLRSLLFSSVGFSLPPRKNAPSTPPQLPREIVLLVNIPRPRELSRHRLQCYTLRALVRIRTALTEIEQAANRISPLLVYILEVTRGRYFAPKYSF
jgi:hypothetical protein